MNIEKMLGLLERSVGYEVLPRQPMKNFLIGLFAGSSMPVDEETNVFHLEERWIEVYPSAKRMIDDACNHCVFSKVQALNVAREIFKLRCSMCSEKARPDYYEVLDVFMEDDLKVLYKKQDGEVKASYPYALTELIDDHIRMAVSTPDYNWGKSNLEEKLREYLISNEDIKMNPVEINEFVEHSMYFSRYLMNGYSSVVNASLDGELTGPKLIGVALLFARYMTMYLATATDERKEELKRNMKRGMCFFKDEIVNLKTSSPKINISLDTF